MQIEETIPRKVAKPQGVKTSFHFAALRLCAILSLLVTAGCRKEQPAACPPDRLTVEYSIDRDTIMIGEPVELVVTAHCPTNGILELPEIGREKEIVLLQHDGEQISGGDGPARHEHRYSITSFQLGGHLISGGDIRCTIGDRLLTTNFPAVVLHVQSALPPDASAELADIKPSRKLPGRIPRWIWIVFGSAAAAFLAGLITSKVRKNRKQIIPSAPPVPPHIIALNALQALKEKNLLEQDECNPFYTELSLILRKYLEGRFLLNAPDETTEEIVEEMSRSPELSGAQRNILQDFMRQADIVKFAKGHPDRQTMESAFHTTKQFVEETRQNETETET